MIKNPTRARKIALPLIIALVALILLNGCQSAAPNATGTQAGQPTQQTGPEFPNHSQADFEAYLNREPTSVMAYAGPFYFGSFDGFDQRSQKYSDQRRQKVDEILGIVDGGIVNLGNLDKKLKEENDIFAWYTQEIQKIDKSTQKYTDGLLHATNLSLLSSSLSNLMLLKKQGDAMEKSAAWGYLQFQKYGDFVELTNLYGVEAASLLSRTSALYYLLEADPNTAYQDLNKQFIAKLDPLTQETSDMLNELYRATAEGNYGEKLLFTSDYYFSRDAIKALDTQIAEAQKSFDGYTGTNQYLSADMLTLLKKKLADMKNYRNGISAFLDKIPAGELIPKETLALNTGSSQSPDQSMLIPVAYAQDDIPGWFQQKISDTIKTVKSVKNLSFAAVRVTGQAIKDAYDKSGAHEFVKDGAQIVNAGLEVVNSTVAVTIHSVQGIYYGDLTWADFKRKIESEKQGIHDRFVAGTLGKEQYDEIIRQVDSFQEKTGKFVNTMGELTGDVSSIVTGQPKVGAFVKDVTIAVGNEAKGVLDGATDFTKNLAIIMHPETTKEQTRNALLGIYTALEGIRDDEGKLVEVEIPDLTKLTKEKALEQVTKDISKAAGLNKTEEKEFIKQLKDTFEEQLKDKETPEETKGSTTSQTAGAGSQEGTTGQTPAATTTTNTTNPATTTTGTTVNENTNGTGNENATGTNGTGTGTTASTTTGTAVSPLDQIFTNPNLTDKQIQDIIIGEITKDLPPLPPKSTTNESTVPENLDTDGDGIPDKSDNCPAIANPDQTDTDNNGLGDACDPGCSGDLDKDGVCNEMDNCPTDSNPDQKDTDGDGKGDVCDFDAPALKDIAGTWPGTMTITDVQITDETRAEAKKEGCDLTELENSKGKEQPMGIIITPNGENGGTITITGKDAPSKPIPFTYTDGVLKASMSDQGASLGFNMTFTDKTGSGDMNMDYMNGGAKITGSMSLKK